MTPNAIAKKLASFQNLEDMKTYFDDVVLKNPHKVVFKIVGLAITDYQISTPILKELLDTDSDSKAVGDEIGYHTQKSSHEDIGIIFEKINLFAKMHSSFEFKTAAVMWAFIFIGNDTLTQSNLFQRLYGETDWYFE